MQRADGTYDLPDENVSPIWQNENGSLIRLCGSLGQLWKWVNSEELYIPKPGRWLPWIAAVFPERRKCAIRLCLGSAHGQQGMFVFHLSREHTHYPFTDQGGVGVRGDSVNKVVWLTPEYEDELTGITHE